MTALMFRRGAVLVAVAALMVGVLPAAQPMLAKEGDVGSLRMFQATKFDAHYVAPRDEAIEQLLKEEKILLPGADATATGSAIRAFKSAWFQRNPTTPSPFKLAALLKGERWNKPKVAASPIKSLVVPVDFPNADTFDWCGTSVTTTGPLHNQMAPPGPRDNNTVWYQDASPSLYSELYFGEGPNAGVIVHHPNLGDVDLRGSTMTNYYLEQSEGAFKPAGSVYPKWLQAAHSEGWYGADSCNGGNNNVRAHDLVKEVVDAVKADNPAFSWQKFDGNADGIVDNFTVIHAGMGQEAGGGAEGEFAIWSHASAIDFPTGYPACVKGSAGCPDRDVFVREYSMDPENIDVGVISEEFGHAAFGLPDLYTTDTDSSISNWAIMESGSWNGKLGGMQPAPFPLWFKYILGWAKPLELNYTTGLSMAKVGQLSLRPAGTQSGIKINLPDKTVEVPNPLGTGQAWWSSVGDLLNNTITHQFDLTGASAPIFSFASSWSIEEDWDYGYVEVSVDGGTTWTILQDMDGVLRNTDPNGNNQGWGLTGEGDGTLRFNLAIYAGQSVLVRLRYSTDLAAQWAGWWADDVTLTDGATTLFSDNVEAGADGWTATGWQLVPKAEVYPRYYLAEWRNLSGFDRGLKYAYQGVYYDEDEWEVDRAPYTVPGMLLYFRDSSYKFDYTLYDSLYDPPSYGPKHGLIVVDSHSFPYMWSNYTSSSGQHVRLSRRVQTGNSTFTLQNTTPFTLRLGYDPATGVYQPAPLETKTFGPLPAVSQFHDSMGYYPGLWYPGYGSSLYFWDTAASTAIPAKGNYTTRITWPDNSPLYDLYGADMGDTILGSGNPGDDGVQYGLHLAVTGKAWDGSWGQISVWNSSALLDLGKKVSGSAASGGTLTYTLSIRNLTPVAQPFVLDDPIPANTTYLMGPGYNRPSNSIHVEGKVAPFMTNFVVVSVKVKPYTPPGTVITNTATLRDDALGDQATVVSTVPKR